jgi:hypothetical protein
MIMISRVMMFGWLQCLFRSLTGPRKGVSETENDPWGAFVEECTLIRRKAKNAHVRAQHPHIPPANTEREREQ